MITDLVLSLRPQVSTRMPRFSMKFFESEEYETDDVRGRIPRALTLAERDHRRIDCFPHLSSDQATARASTHRPIALSSLAYRVRERTALPYPLQFEKKGLLVGWQASSSPRSRRVPCSSISSYTRFAASQSRFLVSIHILVSSFPPQSREEGAKAERSKDGECCTTRIASAPVTGKKYEMEADREPNFENGE